MPDKEPRLRTLCVWVHVLILSGILAVAESASVGTLKGRVTDASQASIPQVWVSKRPSRN